PGVRAGAVRELERVLLSTHAGLALAAKLALEGLAQDDSRTVSAAAEAALGAPGQRAPVPAPVAAPVPTGSEPSGGTAETRGQAERIPPEEAALPPAQASVGVPRRPAATAPMPATGEAAADGGALRQRD